VIGMLKRWIWVEPDMAREERRLNRGAIYILLVLAVLILGLNWPIMATGLTAISPIWMGVFRVAGACVVIVIIGSFSGNMRIPPLRDVPIIASLAVFRLAAVFLLVFSALKLVPAGRSSVVVWTTSLWTVPIAAVFLKERMTAQRWAGLAAGILGVVILFEPWGLQWGDPGVALGHFLLIVAAITLAATSVHIRGHRWTITPLASLPWQLAMATILLTVLGLAIEGLPEIQWTPQLVGVVVYQGLLASGIAFWAQIVVMRNLGAVSANLSLTAVPVVGVLSSAVLLGESITPTLAVGLVLVIFGVALNLATDRRQVDGAPKLSQIL
jgi:drug/metabolite transporter (DMT)-like permease